MPFGGVGYSGYGKYKGYDGFKALSNAKAVFIKVPMKMYPYNQIYPPYDEKRVKFLNFLIKMMNGTQRQFVKRFISLVVFVFLAVLVYKKRLTMDKVKLMGMRLISIIY